ncbi:MAG TPA: WYL domain-containing protein [Solirubrobacteraceae bacterium]|nr:WYL domain-containing protein [Solirubrobacteraceae bacterium]
MAKDTEKLIRQLSLISYLMAERRPVTATEIRRDVEGYSDMTEDAFARRFYADRAELDALGIHLTVDKPADGFSEQENYSLAPEAFHLPAIAFTDDERAALQTALTLLDGEFAYAEPLRLALQQITWGRPSPLGSDLRQTIGLGITASAGGAELSARLAKIDTAIYRRKRIEFDYYTMQSDATASRKVDPYHLLFEGGQFYLVGFSHERGDVRVFRLSRIRGKVAYATKAEHDFQRPADFDPREYAGRVPWQLGEPVGSAQIWVSDDVSWYVERQFGAYGELHDNVFTTRFANPRLLISWALGLREHARVDGPAELAEEARERIDRIVELHRGDPPAITAAPSAATADGEPQVRTRSPEGTIRPERFARLVTLASVLIAAGREDRRLPVDDVCRQLNMTAQELREDISVLNVVNFGGGAYVIYAEVLASGEIEVDPEPYSDTFDRPARLLPIEAKALVAAIDLLNLAQPELGTAREKVVEALGHDPVEEGLQIASPTVADEVAHTVERAVHDSRLLELEYWDEKRFSERRVEPYALFNGQDAWYVAVYDLDREQLRHFRLDRIKRATALDEHFERRPDLDPIADVGGWPRTGTVEGSRVARVWISPEQARWAREKRTVVAELEDGAVVVELPFKGIDFLVKEVLKEAGDAAVLEPADARDAVLAAAERLLAPSG